MARDTVTETAQEFDAIAHLRGWCHDTRTCPICTTQRRAYEQGYDRAITMVAEGR